ncbi:MAG: hypothetical protein Q7J34_09045 [Bacteroidales bacterium]|jgi:hypothetical protein|nr:hypothetical protein [Bacteroidales bacterium]
MKRAGLISLVLCLTGASYAQGWEGIPGASASGMGIVGTALQNTWAASVNPAALSGIDNYSIGVYYTDRFRVSDLSTKNVSAVLPVGRGAFGASFSYFGQAMYNEQRYSVAYGLPLYQQIHAGVSLDYCSLNQGGGYGSASAVTFGIGLQCLLNQNLVLGVNAFNPLRVTFGSETSAQIPAVFSAGLMGMITNSLRCGFEIQQDWDTSPKLKTGFEYDIQKWMFIRGGVAINPGIWSAGAGFLWKEMCLDISSSWHPQLGVSSAVSMCYSF